MRRKHFKLGLVILVGLACYFLALSAVLVASARIPEGSGFSARKTSHTQRNLPGELSANLPSDGKASPHGSRFQTASTGNSDENPCLASPASCSGGLFDQGIDASNWQAQGQGDSIVTNGKGSPFGDRSSSYPASYGFNLFGAGGAGSGPSGGTGENGGSSSNSSDGSPTGTGDTGDGTPPGLSGPDPGPSSPLNEPGIGSPPQISLFFPSDPPGSGDPGPSMGTLPPPPSDPPPPHPVPEPSTFWLFLGSLTSVALALRPAKRLAVPTAPNSHIAERKRHRAMQLLSF
jgi:hypothetical protein